MGGSCICPRSILMSEHHHWFASAAANHFCLMKCSAEIAAITIKLHLQRTRPGERRHRLSSRKLPTGKISMLQRNGDNQDHLLRTAPLCPSNLLSALNPNRQTRRIPVPSIKPLLNPNQHTRMLASPGNPGRYGSHSQSSQVSQGNLPNQVSFMEREISMVLLAQTGRLLPRIRIMVMACQALARIIMGLPLPSSKRHFMLLLHSFHSQCQEAFRQVGAMDISQEASTSLQPGRATRRSV
jgi:hypothetical protein